jgi:hypothetical protein
MGETARRYRANNRKASRPGTSNEESVMAKKIVELKLSELKIVAGGNTVLTGVKPPIAKSPVAVA